MMCGEFIKVVVVFKIFKFGGKSVVEVFYVLFWYMIIGFLGLGKFMVLCNLGFCFFYFSKSGGGV